MTNIPPDETVTCENDSMGEWRIGECGTEEYIIIVTTNKLMLSGTKSSME